MRDGNPCNGVETCAPAPGCLPGTPIACSDGNACNGLETCVPATGACQPGAPPVCVDANPCTDDACAPASGCTFTPNTMPCDDGDACTTGDACADALCTGAPLACGPCESCAAGSCIVGPSPACESGGSAFRAQLVLRDKPADAGDFDVFYRSGVLGSLWAMQAVYPHMKDAGWGRIVNFGSSMGRVGGEGFGAYNA